jgi:hypothetical protein
VRALAMIYRVRLLAIIVAVWGCHQKEIAGPSAPGIDHTGVHENAANAPDAAPPPGPKVYKHMRGADEASAFLACARSLDETKLPACYTADARADVADEDVEALGPTEITQRLTHLGVPELGFEPQLTLVAGANVASIVLAKGRRLAILEARLVTLDAELKIAVEEHAFNVLDALAQLGQVRGVTPRRPLPDSWPTRRVFVAQGTPAEDAAVNAYRAALGKPSADAYADNATLHDATAPGDLVGKQAIAGALPLAAQVDTIWAAGPFVVASLDEKGAIKGKDVELHAVGFARVDAATGKIAEEWRFADGLALATQLGTKITYVK